MGIRSQKYSTLAVMNCSQYKELAFNFPIVDIRFREYIYSYHDQVK